MRKYLLMIAAVASSFAFAGPAWAGSPHFVDSATVSSVSGDTAKVSAKEAGLGDEPQIHVVLSGHAACINGGNNQPDAANKESFSAAKDEPVQNGKADYTIELTATFKPKCSPPMRVQWFDLKLTDETNHLTIDIPVT